MRASHREVLSYFPCVAHTYCSRAVAGGCSEGAAESCGTAACVRRHARRGSRRGPSPCGWRQRPCGRIAETQGGLCREPGGRHLSLQPASDTLSLRGALCACGFFVFFWGSERAALDPCGVDCLPWVGRTSLHVSTRGALRSARARACRPSAGDARARERVVSPADAGVVWLGSGWQWGLGTAAAHVAPASARVIERDGEAVSSQRNGQIRGLVSFDLSQWYSSMQ